MKHLKDIASFNNVKKILQLIAALIAIASGTTAILPNPHPPVNEAVVLAHKVLDVMALNIHHNARTDDGTLTGE